MTYAIVTCSEHFKELALNEIRRFHPTVQVTKQLSSQHVLVQAPTTYHQFVTPFCDKLPIYLHHIAPVQRRFSIRDRPSDLDVICRQAVELCEQPFVPHVTSKMKYTYSERDLENHLCCYLPQTNPHADRIVSIFIADKRCYMGVSWLNQTISPFCKGYPIFDEPVSNRAGFKLLEALETFNIRLRPNDHALDLGAAPGAWTEILRRRNLCVTAVAPQEMYKSLQSDVGVRHFHLKADQFLKQCHTTFDLIVNDMYLDARDSARLMVDFARHLRSGGIAIMTLKLRMKKQRRVMDHAFRILRKQYKIICVRQLVSNRKEVTLFLRRKM